MLVLFCSVLTLLLSPIKRAILCAQFALISYIVSHWMIGTLKQAVRYLSTYRTVLTYSTQPLSSPRCPPLAQHFSLHCFSVTLLHHFTISLPYLQ